MGPSFWGIVPRVAVHPPWKGGRILGPSSTGVKSPFPANLLDAKESFRVLVV